MKQKYEIEILGMPLTLKTEESEESLKKNAAILEKRVNDLIYENARLTKGQAMLFLALNYLSEIDGLKAEVQRLKDSSSK